MTRLIRRRWMLGCAAALTLVSAAHAQRNTPLPIVVPAPAGSAPDIVARLVADGLRTHLGQATVIDNRPGAGGIVAVMATQAASNPETLLLAHAAVAAITPHMYRAAKYNLATDMEPIAILAESPMLLVAHPATGPQSLSALLQPAAAGTAPVPTGSTSRGSIPYLTAQMLSQHSKVPLNIVPMANSGQALQAVVNGDTQISVDGSAPLLPLVRAGKLRALATTATRPLPGLEDVPLARDTLPGLEATGWFMLFARKGTSPQRIQEINQAVNAALRSPELQQKLSATANYVVGGSVQEAHSFLAAEQKRWAAAVQHAGLQPE